MPAEPPPTRLFGETVGFPHLAAWDSHLVPRPGVWGNGGFISSKTGCVSQFRHPLYRKCLSSARWGTCWGRVLQDTFHHLESRRFGLGLLHSQVGLPSYPAHPPCPRRTHPSQPACVFGTPELPQSTRLLGTLYKSDVPCLMPIWHGQPCSQLPCITGIQDEGQSGSS